MRGRRLQVVDLTATLDERMYVTCRPGQTHSHAIELRARPVRIDIGRSGARALDISDTRVGELKMAQMRRAVAGFIHRIDLGAVVLERFPTQRTRVAFQVAA